MADKQKIIICPAAELPPGENKLVDLDGVQIAVFNVAGKLHAIRNECPHMGAPMLYGKVCGTMLPSNPHQYQYGCDNEIIRCPWHGWEFEMESGRSIYDRTKGSRLQTFEVHCEQESIVLYKKIPTVKG